MGWGGLVENGFLYVEDQAKGVFDRYKRDIDRAKELLSLPDRTTQDQFEAINRLEELFTKRPDLFAGWLKHQFNTLYDITEDRSILDSLRQLHRHGAMLLTTNYDDLLEKHCGIPPVGRTDTTGLLSYQRKSLDGVFHPHGHWKDPDNIVLSARNYHDVLRDRAVQDVLTNIVSNRTILFVGAGEGLDDPNWGQLLHWVGESHRKKGPTHYVLFPKSIGNEIPHMPLNYVTCETRDDIARWLRGLLEPDEQREGTVYENKDNTRRVNVNHWLSPLDQTQFLKDHSDIQDKVTPFYQSVIGQPNFWETDKPTYVWLTGNGGFGKTMFCSSVINSTRQSCRLETAHRSRDSLAYFFCATYDVLDRGSATAYHDFSAFCRTVIDQLCPPYTVYPALQDLYTACTEYHPARSPTNSELRDVLVTILDQLTRKKSTEPNTSVQPGETYLVLDGFDKLPRNRQGPYLEFVRDIRARKLDHFHLLVSSRDTARIRSPLRSYGEWNQVTCNQASVKDVIRSFVIRSIYNEPQFHDLAQKIREPLTLWLIDQLTTSEHTFWWVYWKVQDLKELDFFDRESIQEILHDSEDERVEQPKAKRRRTLRSN
ncbi:SIR2-like domain-containing protein [Daldinia sp. FL1419]|nr:SIR2-like domain-containing protein [Daldinia sp. FL1419]